MWIVVVVFLISTCLHHNVSVSFWFLRACFYAGSVLTLTLLFKNVKPPPQFHFSIKQKAETWAPWFAVSVGGSHTEHRRIARNLWFSQASTCTHHDSWAGGGQRSQDARKHTPSPALPPPKRMRPQTRITCTPPPPTPPKRRKQPPIQAQT